MLQQIHAIVAVEPFTFENIDDYERARDNSIKFDPGRVVHDSKEDELETIDSRYSGSSILAAGIAS